MRGTSWIFGLVVAGLAVGCSSGSGGGGDAGTETDTDTATEMGCTEGEYDGDFLIQMPSDAETLAGYTSISGNLFIECPSCTDLKELSCLAEAHGFVSIGECTTLTGLNGLSGITAVDDTLYVSGNTSLTSLDGLGALESLGGGLSINNNAALANLDGLGTLMSVNWDVTVFDNDALPDCEVCDLLDQFTSAPSWTDVHDNLSDACTPVPDNCP